MPNGFDIAVFFRYNEENKKYTVRGAVLISKLGLDNGVLYTWKKGKIAEGKWPSVPLFLGLQ